MTRGIHDGMCTEYRAAFYIKWRRSPYYIIQNNHKVFNKILSYMISNKDEGIILYIYIYIQDLISLLLYIITTIRVLILVVTIWRNKKVWKSPRWSKYNGFLARFHLFGGKKKKKREKKMKKKKKKKEKRPLPPFKVSAVI